MNVSETLKQSFSSILANKLRSGLTLLALVIGVFSVIVSTTAVAVLDNYFTTSLSFMGSDVINVSRFPSVNIGSFDSSLRNRKFIGFDTAEELEKRMRIADGMSPDEFFRITKIQYGKEETQPDVWVKGSNMHYLSNNAYELEDGRNLTSDDVQYGRSVAIIGKDVQNEIFQNVYPIGKSIRVDGKPYTVIGITEAKGRVLGQSFDNYILIPYTTGMNVYGAKRDVEIQVRAPEIAMIERTVDEITGILRVIRGVAPGEENDFEISTNESLGGTFDVFTNALYLGGFVIGFITLLGAGIGVMNIMLVSVTERTKEIGIRKAVGATRKAIVNQFLMEAIFICQLGGIVGIILGIAGGNVVALMIDAEVVIPISSVILGFVAMLVIGVVFGVYPAYKASILDPIESLRYE